MASVKQLIFSIVIFAAILVTVQGELIFFVNDDYEVVGSPMIRPECSSEARHRSSGT